MKAIFIYSDAAGKSAEHIILLIYFYGPFMLVMSQWSEIDDMRFSICRRKFWMFCGGWEETFVENWRLGRMKI
jgi:hypothetical protein